MVVLAFDQAAFEQILHPYLLEKANDEHVTGALLHFGELAVFQYLAVADALAADLGALLLLILQMMHQKGF